MAGQGASGRATKIPCSGYLLNAKGYLQADRKPSAPRAARSRPPSCAVSKVLHKLLQGQPQPRGAPGFAGEKINPPDRRVCPGCSHCHSVSLSACCAPSTGHSLLLRTLCWKCISEISCHGSTSVEPPTWGMDTAWSTCDNQAGHRVSLSTWAIWNIYSWHNRAA